MLSFAPLVPSKLEPDRASASEIVKLYGKAISIFRHHHTTYFSIIFKYSMVRDAGSHLYRL